jgi:hypothetical protein
MTLPASPLPISMSQLNTELTLPVGGLISLNQANVRTLAGAQGSGTIINMGSLRGKSAYAGQLIFNDARTFAIGDIFAGSAGAGTTGGFNLNSNGTISLYGLLNATNGGPTQYLSILQSSAGSLFEAQLRYAIIGFGSGTILGTSAAGSGIANSDFNGTLIGHQFAGTSPNVLLGDLNFYDTPWVKLDSTRVTSLTPTPGFFLQMIFTLQIRRVGTTQVISRTGFISE